MSRLDLNEYSNEEILNAMFELRAGKLISLLQALKAVIIELNANDERILREQDEQVSTIIKRVLNRR